MCFQWPNDGGNLAATKNRRFQNPPDPPLGFTTLCTPGMGVVLWRASPLYESGSLKDFKIPNDRSD